jgi:hypothetical protein
MLQCAHACHRRCATKQFQKSTKKAQMPNFNGDHLQEILRLHQQGLSESAKAQADGSSAGRRERKKLQTRSLLMESAWALFENLGYDQVSMEQIAGVAETSKVTLYKYFPAKESLLSEKLNDAIPLDACVSVNSEIELSICVSQLVSWACTYRTYLPIYINYRLGSACKAENGMGSAFRRLAIQRLAHTPTLTFPLPRARLGTYLEMLCLGAMREWLQDPAFELDRELRQILMLGLAIPSVQHQGKISANPANESASC